MRCPYCNHTESKVTDSRAMDEGIRRRRECLQCGVRFTTYERIQNMALMVAKRDGRREDFRRDKLMTGITKACVKRPVPLKEIERVVEEIEAELQNVGRAEIPSSQIGEMVMRKLKKLDRVAYIRFASVYRDFNNIDNFEQAVRELRSEALTDTEEETIQVKTAPEVATETAQLSFLPPGETRTRAKSRPARRAR